MPESRRKFINTLIGGGLFGWLAGVIYPVVTYLKPPEVTEAVVNSVKAGSVNDFPLNSGSIVKFGRNPVILIHTEDDRFIANSATCTHLDCIVQFRPDMKHIWCACHNGHYDLNGRNISGPPPRPLTPYDVNIVDDEVIVAKVQQTA